MSPNLTCPSDHSDTIELALQRTETLGDEKENKDDHVLVGEVISSSIKKDNYFDGQQDIIEVFDYDLKEFHSFWVWFNYTSPVANLVFFAALKAQLVCLFTGMYTLSCFASCFLVFNGFFGPGCIQFLFLRMISDSKESPHTAITCHGIRHIQPAAGTGDGSEVFIPFCKVKDVKVSVIQPLCHRCPMHYLVSRVHISLVLEDETSLSMSGIQNVLQEREVWRKFRSVRIRNSACVLRGNLVPNTSTSGFT